MAAKPKPGIFSSLRGGASGSVFSASLLLMVSALLSGVLGLVRGKLIAYLFGAGPAVDAYTAAFELPDTIYYFLIGGVASTTLIKLLAQYGAEGREDEGDHALSNILNVMLTVLGVAALLGIPLVPLYVRLKFHNFDSPETAHMCVQMTRILLFNPLLLLAGGVFGSRLMARKIFIFQALQPLLYNGGIIASVWLLHGRFGPYSMAIGAAFGAFVGFFLINFFGARSIGMEWTPKYDLRHPALHQWVRMSLPLMLGAGLVTLDPQIRSYFASEVKGAVSLMNYSRQLFAAPMGIIGPAAGAASLPFFASLWAAGETERFSAAVNRAVSRLLAVSLLITAWMIALAAPIVDVALRGGRFDQADTAEAAQLLVLFSLSLVFWTSQNLYARAFYAAGNTLTPMIAGTVIFALSLPVYAAFFHSSSAWGGVRGLVIASDIGIAANMVTLAVLLHTKRMVSLAEMQWGELARALLAAIASAFAVTWCMRVLPLGALLATASLSSTSHLANFVRLLAGSAVWLVVAAAVLLVTKSSLPNALLRRGSRSAAMAAAKPVTAADAP